MLLKINVASDDYDQPAGVAWCQMHGMDPVRILDTWIDTEAKKVTFLQMIDGNVTRVDEETQKAANIGAEFPEGVTARRAALDHGLIVHGLTNFGPEEKVPEDLLDEMDQALLCVRRVVDLVEMPAAHLLYGGGKTGV